MPDRDKDVARVRRVDGLTIVSLCVGRKLRNTAPERLGLAPPLSARMGEPGSLWLGPESWLLTSRSLSPARIMQCCAEMLDGELYHSVNVSAGISVFDVLGTGAREVLESGCCLDLRPKAFRPGSCARTRLAMIAAVVVSDKQSRFRVFVERSYGNYLEQWLSDLTELTVRSHEATHFA